MAMMMLFDWLCQESISANGWSFLLRSFGSQYSWLAGCIYERLQSPSNKHCCRDNMTMTLARMWDAGEEGRVQK